MKSNINIQWDHIQNAFYMLKPEQQNGSAENLYDNTTSTMEAFKDSIKSLDPIINLSLTNFMSNFLPGTRTIAELFYELELHFAWMRVNVIEMKLDYLISLSEVL